MTAGIVLLAGGAAAGLFGSLLGLGGGILIVPLLAFGFGVPLRESVAVSLVAVIVTSTAGAGVYLRRHVANLRLGMVLELFTACGALVGGLVAFAIDERVLAGLFTIVLTWVAISMIRQGRRGASARSDDGEGDPTRSPPIRTSTAGRRPPAPASRRSLRGRPRPSRWPTTRRSPTGSPGRGIASTTSGSAWSRRRRGHRVRAPRHRWRDHQGSGHALRHGRAAPGRDRDEQPDDRHHRDDGRDLPAPGWDRRLCRRAHRGRGVHRGHDRVADGPPRRLRVPPLLFVIVVLYTAYEMFRRALGG